MAFIFFRLSQLAMLNQGTGVVCLPHADSALLGREFQFGDLTGSKLKGEIVTLVGWGRTLYSSTGDQAVSLFEKKFSSQ